METMEKHDMSDLQSVVKIQKEQLERYENRFRDLLTAYKGLLKEKEALESSLGALSNAKGNNTDGSVSDNSKSNKSNITLDQSTRHDNTNDHEKIHQLELQLATVMNSLATLSAEKSRMEASFQADKKQLRLEREAKDKIIKELKETLKKCNKQFNTELETVKSKLIIERHDREKEQNDHGVMIRELQKLLSDERNVKEQLETQVADLKLKIRDLKTNSHCDISNNKETQLELKEAKKNIRPLELESGESNQLLHELQSEITNMKLHHAEVLEQEKERARIAEEKARSLAAVHEERVANLETRLAELSDTVGTYDRLRQNDLTNIQKLKDEIAHLCKMPKSINDESNFGECEENNVQNIITKIMKLKKNLLMENERLEKPMDISNLFICGVDHSKCKDEYNKLMQEYYEYKLKTKHALNINVSMEVQDLKSHIKSLQDEIIILNNQLDKNESLYNTNIEAQAQKLLAEKTYWKNVVSNIEAEFKEHINQLESQLQKQRDRSIGLLEEKEEEIKALKESFEVFLPGNANLYLEKSKQKLDEQNSHNLCQLNNVLQGGPSVSSGESPHMLHYAHELARRDVDISILRRQLRELEDKYREVNREKTLLQDNWCEKELVFQENINRLQRCMSREGANLEYLKNVVMSYILSTDTYGRTHMLNAIAAVLKFSPEEIERINKHNTVKLYSTSNS